MILRLYKLHQYVIQKCIKSISTMYIQKYYNIYRRWIDFKIENKIFIDMHKEWKNSRISNWLSENAKEAKLLITKLRC